MLLRNSFLTCGAMILLFHSLSLSLSLFSTPLAQMMHLGQIAVLGHMAFKEVLLVTVLEVNKIAISLRYVLSIVFRRLSLYYGIDSCVEYTYLSK